MSENEDIVQTVVFNARLCTNLQFCVNCRRLDNKLNIFEGITHNFYFIGITLLGMYLVASLYMLLLTCIIEIVVQVQVLIVFVGGPAFQVVRIDGREWGISMAVGFVSNPWGAVIRCLPNALFETFFKFIRLMGKPEFLPTISPDRKGGVVRSPLFETTLVPLQTFMVVI